MMDPSPSEKRNMLLWTLALMLLIVAIWKLI
jgi:predicted nucleic acid-binding Zn ribbon protein